jgi:hypothetical protein
MRGELMPPKKKVTKAPRPVHLAELCSECGLYPVHPDYTSWSCEHGTWNLADDYAAADDENPVLDVADDDSSKTDDPGKAETDVEA